MRLLSSNPLSSQCVRGHVEMKSKEINNLDFLRNLWKEGNDIAEQLDSTNNDQRYTATKNAWRWQRRLQIIFKSMFYNPRFFNELMEVFPRDNGFDINFSSKEINTILGHIEGIGQMLKFGYIKDQFAGINNDHSAICFVAMAFANEYNDLFDLGISLHEFLGFRLFELIISHNDRTDANI